MARTSRPLSILPISLRDATVARIEDISPATRRLTLAGPQLRGGIREGARIPAVVSDGFDDHVKLVIPGPDGTVPFAGRQEGDRFAWEPGVLPRTRDYTVRRLDLEAGEMDVDLVRHDSGLASDWAFSCAVGDAISFAGPKMSAGIAADVDWHLLMGDETALPAIGRWLEEAPAGTRARVIVEVPSAADRQDIPTAADAEITWLIREPGVRPGFSPLLLEAVRALEMPPGRVFAWCAGETLTIAPIRRHLRRERGLPKEDVEVVGYWRRTADAPAAAGDASPAVPAPRDLQMQVHEMSELLAPIALRLSVTLGIPLHLEAGRGTLEELVEDTGVPAPRLSPLLDALVALGLVREDDGRLVATALGEVLLEESAQEVLDLSSPANRRVLALADLLGTLRTGEVAASPVIPAPVGAWRAADPRIEEAFDEEAEAQLRWSLPPLVAVPEVRSAQRVLLAGDGLIPTAGALLAADPAREVVIAVAAHRIARIRERLDGALPPERRTRVQVRDLTAPTDLPAAQTALLQGVMDGTADAEVAELLAAISPQVTGHVVVVTDSADTAREDDHAAERSLVSLAATGTALRTTAQVAALLAAAGFPDARRRPLGWGFGVSLVVAGAPGA